MSVKFTNLTSKQKKVYSAIERYIKSQGIPPTVREIGEMLGEKTPGAVQGILNRLEQKGVIKRQVGMARSIQLVYPEDTFYLKPVYVPQIKKITQRNVGNLLNMYNIVNYHPISPELVPAKQKCFALDCFNDSLANSGIKYGDKLFIQMSPQIENGDIVIALYQNYTLIRRYVGSHKPDLLTLEADNYIIDKKLFRRNEIRIIGKLILKCKKY